MKKLFTERDANALFNGVPFISIEVANKLIEARLAPKEPTPKRKKSPKRSK